MSRSPTIVWFRQDLRLDDHPALSRAMARKAPVIPLYVWAPEEEGGWAPGAASRWWLHQSLTELEAALARRGSRLIIRRGAALAAIREVVSATGAGAVYWHRRYEPAAIARDAAVKSDLREGGLEAESFNGALLHEPWTVKTKAGGPFQVFTPFWKACLAKPDPAPPHGTPRKIPAPVVWPPSLQIDDLELEPRRSWATGFRAMWTPGPAGARAHLRRFLAESFDDYAEGRNRPDQAGTSRLSPHLHLGEISPRQVWHQVAAYAARRGWSARRWRGAQYLTEIGWREFSHHLLFHFPRIASEPLRAEFARFRWIRDPVLERAWRRGQTGFPIVDAGMRELWGAGWMHNRVRMIVASFLVKDLGISWLDGARWFWDTLVDADLAQNTLGWQWTAGCGADAAPFFRIFNPTTQGEKFDPDGRYVRRWVPELAHLGNEWIHRPGDAPVQVLQAAGVRLGETYPRPIVDHGAARVRALAAYQELRGEIPVG